MSYQLHRALARRLPRHGDRSKLVVRMIEMWLRGDIQIPDLRLKSLSAGGCTATSNVAESNTKSPSPEVVPEQVLDWQLP